MLFGIYMEIMRNQRLLGGAGCFPFTFLFINDILGACSSDWPVGGGSHFLGYSKGWQLTRDTLLVGGC